ncbi:nucleoside hydrolase [Ornithinibacillus halotolerans]|uniref:Inosine-uridine preferring nucleoside hydrolase n=1 Tax=Ornithinibacillus halotolerans TaxID=1274357 RepID=A0A916S1L3_9BACI|nr:nucleoside hydrolase [Ornithinibacillus halotolerans]GGA77463.1 inosine-uridine preferring nucleoside hydrolase [Ornithinibacillus halotolerans]
MGKKVLVFADIGIDDIIALIYGYLNDDIDIVGIVTEYGNIPRENALATVRYLNEQVLITDESTQAVLIAGAENPMIAETVEFVPEIHGEYGMGPVIPENPEDGFTLENFFTIVDLIDQYGDELYIVNIGRMTSLATMFLLYPNKMEKIKNIYVMGGAFWEPGNITAVSEANFHGDPVAAQIVLTYADNVTIIPLNVTKNAIVTPEMVDYIDQVGTIDIVKPMIDFYYNFYKERDPSVPGSPLHDVLTLMAVNNEDMFSYEEYPVHIVQATRGTERGQSIADIRPFGNLEEETEKEIKTHRIAFNFDYPTFFKDFMSTMSEQRIE